MRWRAGFRQNIMHNFRNCKGLVLTERDCRFTVTFTYRYKRHSVQELATCSESSCICASSARKAIANGSREPLDCVCADVERVINLLQVRARSDHALNVLACQSSPPVIEILSPRWRLQSSKAMIRRPLWWHRHQLWPWSQQSLQDCLQDLQQENVQKIKQ